MLTPPKMRPGQLPLLAWLGGVLLFWQYLASGGITFSGAVFIVSLPFGWYFIGDLFLKLALQDNARLDNLPARLAGGIILANVLLYAVVLVLPVGPGSGWWLMQALALPAWVLARQAPVGPAAPVERGPELFFLLLTPVAVTFWCRELLSPEQPDGAVVVIRAWQDIYSHVCAITDFAASRGFGTISDMHGAGIPSLPYHQAGYMLPAALADDAGVSSLAAYAGLMVPLGLLVGAWAGYALAAVVFGRWPALAAGLALLLLPDAVQQGAGNPFLGYQWMQQSAPACGYGLAAAALVFALLHEACRTRSYRLVAFAWLFVAFTLLHKAQIFFAIAFLALIFPSLFLAGLSRKHRILSLLLVVVVFAFVVTVSQSLPGVPVIRLDGSGLMRYSRLILNNQADGFLQQAFTALFAESYANWPYRAAAFALLLTVVTLGVYPLVYLVQVGRLRRNVDRRVWLFPLLVGAFYLVTSIGLAMDDRQLGTSVELLHRPFLWAYFVVVLWTAAATYRMFFPDGLPATRTARLALAAGALALLLVPAWFGTGIQTLPHWGFGHQRLPAGQFAAARFIRTNSARDELVQDARPATGVILAALCERRPFAITTGGAREPDALAARLQALEAMHEMRDGRQVEAFMRRNKIRWYVLNPGDSIPWTETLGRPPAFESTGFRVYRF